MAQLTMYPAEAGSKRTTLTADLAADGTQALVGDLSAFPTAPNLATIQSDSTIWETCLYTEKSAESGAGYLTITRSGEGHDSSASGGALLWSSGAIISRNPCGLDHDRFKANIEDIAANTQPLDATLTALAGLTTAANKLPYATGEDAFDICDFTDLGRSLIGETTESAVRDLIFATSGTIATQSIYVDSAATGTGTGVDWANAFATIQAAVDSLPAIINHDVTIYVRKGSSAYIDSITVQRVVANGSITIRGEYYWYGTVAATATGKITLGVSDFGYDDKAQIEVGDTVIVQKYSGTVGASVPSISYIDTVASVSGAEVTLAGWTAISFDSTYQYCIIKTDMSGSESYAINVLNSNSVTISGINVNSGINGCINFSNARNANVNQCYCNGGIYGMYCGDLSKCRVFQSYFASVSNNATGVYISPLSYAEIRNCTIRLTGTGTTGISAAYVSAALFWYNQISAAAVGIKAQKNSYVYDMGLNDNDATIAKSPASSTDGSYIQ